MPVAGIWASLGGIWGLLKSLPKILDGIKWAVEKLGEQIRQWKKSRSKKETREAIKEGFKEGDSRRLEDHFKNK